MSCRNCTEMVLADIPGQCPMCGGQPHDSGPEPRCPVCEAPLAEHTRSKPCVQSKPSTAKNLWDLPLFGWAWSEDGKDTQS